MGVKALLDYVRMQLLGVFLAPGSTISIAALSATLIVALILLARAKTSTRPLALAVAIRALAPRRSWRSASGRADIGWFMFSLFGSGLLIGWAIVLTTTVSGVVDGALGPGSLLALPALPAIAIATIASFLAYEAAYYLDHRLMHRVPWLWPFHRVHHSAEHLSLLTVFRVHPLETIGFYNLVALFVGGVQGVMPHLIGPHAAPHVIGQTNVVLFVGAVLITHLQHSHFWVRLGDRWGWLLLGPAHHQIHHSNDPAHFDSNFGNLLTLFDRLFGTFHMPAAKRPALRFGADGETANPHGVAAMTVLPFAEAAETMRDRQADPVTS